MVHFNKMKDMSRFLKMSAVCLQFGSHFFVFILQDKCWEPRIKPFHMIVRCFQVTDLDDVKSGVTV